MSCCPHCTTDVRPGPKATSTTLSIPHSLSCLLRPRSLREADTKRPFCYHAGNPNAKGISSERAATQMCMQVKLIPPTFPAPTLSCPESATFLLGQAPRNLLRLRFLWICFLQKTGGHLAKTSHIINPQEKRSWLSSRVDKRGCTAQENLAPRSEHTS